MDVQEMRLRSGTVVDDTPLTKFLYIVMRDGHISPGAIESIMINNEIDENPFEIVNYTNGWIANYAIDLGNRLRQTREPL